jgi:hypothetical protein
MEAMRNYTQHRAFLVHAMTRSIEREDMNPGSLLRAGLHLFVEVQRLKEDPKFKKQALDELAAVAERGHVNLTPLVREYVERLCEVHKSLHSLISADVASWDQTIISVLDRACGAFGEDLSGLGIAEEEADYEGEYIWVDSASIFREPIDWRKRLEAKNPDFGKLSARYVTGHAGRPHHK